MTAPILRFKDQGRSYPDWVQKKLKDCVTFSKGGSLSKSDLSPHGATPCLLYGELYTTYGEVTKAVINKTDSTEDLVKSQMNDVILPMSGETAEDIAKATCIKQEGVAYGGDLMVLRSKSLDGCFLSYSLNSINRRQISRIAQGKTVVHINPSRVSDISINVACLEEQQKIASFFSTLDKKIYNLEKQISCVDILKKAIYSKVFSRQNIASWNRSKFCEEFAFKRTFSLSRKEISTDDSVSHSEQKIIHYGDILTIYGDIVNPGIDKIGCVLNELSVDKSDYLKDGDVIFADAAEDYSVGKAIELIGVTTELLSGLHTIAVTPQNSFASGYWSCYFNSPIFKSQVKTLAVGTKVMSLTKSAIKTTDVYYPSVQEQERISNLFFWLEQKRKIVLMKISTIKKLKSAFMQQMFV